MNTYTIRQFAERFGLSVKTLQRWDREGKLNPLRTPGNRRQYTNDHIQQALGVRGIQTPPAPRKTVVYLPVSRHVQGGLLPSVSADNNLAGAGLNAFQECLRWFIVPVPTPA